jgi:filamentous hemagglutinin family protein
MHKILRSLRASTALTPAAMLVSALTGTAAQALPQNGTVAGGSATITQSSPGELDINQATSRAVIDWQSFSIGANETTRFIQPNSGSVAVNRVTGIDPSLIEGRLSANGQIVLVNPNGILFDKGARVNVGGLIASTSDISTANAMAGNMVFDKASSSSTATIVNRGRITAAEGGLVALVAPGVANSGVISARLGKVALASGNSWALDLYGDRLVSFGVNDQVVNTVAGPDNTGIGVANSGKIYADAGRVELTADIAKGIVSNAINMSGVIEASSIHQAGGSIVLDGGASGVSIIGTAQANGTTGGTIAVAGDSVVNQGLLSANGTSGAGGTINVSAQSAYIDTENASLSAAGTSGGAVSVTSQGSLFGSGSVSATGSGGTGGSIAMTAPSLALIGTTIDASGTTGGGTIDIGGGPQGSGALAHAQTVTVSGASTLTADAISGGNGGSITVWSDDATSFSGTASAKGGFSFGNGGTIEVSSAGTDSFAGLANASALQGTAGSLLLDPKAIIIEASAGTLPQFQLVDPNPNSGGNFGTAIVSLGNGNVVVTDPNDTLGSGPSDTGAAYLFNGITGQLISTLTGSYLDDHVGLSVTALTGNNNFVVSSPDWSGNKGAATLVNGTTGLAGSVSASNSLTGSLAGDEVGLTVTALANGNYVVSSPDWTGGKGAATFVNGALGLTGTVSAANSLIGSSTGDAVGASVTALTNGNYVVNSPDWDGTLGAATFANGTAGVTGTVSAANSLVGTVSGDEVGLATTALSNGNYVVASEDWHGGEGAATWGNGATGLTASVSSANSLTGTLTTDHVAASVTALANGNYVVASPSWGLGKGAAIWGNGATGLTGTISTANALTGSAITDHVGASVTALANGNYVVNSPSWSLGKGAATFANGILGLTGTVGAANSYTGSSITDGAGLFTTALSNGNYVVSLPGWNGTIGAAAFASGSLGLTGVAGAANALTGSTIGDTVGLHVTALSDGNYVVGSPDWNGNKGAATWASGTLGLTGTVSASNSLIGSTTGDLIGSSIVPLSAGGYLVVSASFDSGLGAVVLGSAGNILTGTVNAVDSILGTILESTPSLNVVAGVNGTFYIGWPNLNSGGVTVGTDNPNGLTYADNPSGTITITPSFLTQTLDTGTAVTLQANDDITVDSAIVENATGTGGALTLDAGRSLHRQR